MKSLIFIMICLSAHILADSQILKFSNSTIPYIDVYSDTSAKNGFNNELTKRLNRLKCSSKESRQPNTFWENYTSVQYSKNNIVSLKIRSNYNCDGVHPFNDIDHSFTYDLENNREATLFDIFTKKGNTFDLIRKKFYEVIKDENCRDKVNFYLESEKLFKDYLNYYLDNEGIVFILKLPYGIRHCADDLKITYQDLYKHSSYVGILKKVLLKYEMMEKQKKAGDN